MITVNKGLENVVVGESAISLVDGLAGTLSYRGRSVEDWVTHSFEEVAHHVILDKPPTDDFSARLAEGGALNTREVTAVLSIPAETHPMHVIQGLTPLLTRNNLFEEFDEASHGLTIAAKLPTLLTTFLTRKYQTPGTSFHGNFVSQLQGPHHKSALMAFEVTQILQLEHGFNASTFAARVIASTLAPIENVIAGAFGALHGPLHGGADQAALETADKVGDPAKASAFVDDCLARNQKVMGMGHREYKVIDPRAKHVKKFACEITQGSAFEQTYLILEAIEARFRERMLEKNKELHANLEFYKGLIYRVLGLPTEFFTATFAMSRVFGYIAHFIESRQDNRLIRPAVAYSGR